MKSKLKAIIKALKIVFNKRNIILIVTLLIGLGLYFLTDARYMALMVIIPVVLMVLSLIIILATGRNISAEIDCPVQGAKGHPEKVTVRLTNNGLLPVLMCEFDAKMQNMLTGKSFTEKLPVSIGHKKTQEFQYDVLADTCGCVHVEADNIKISDPLRIFMRRPKTLTLPKSESQNIYFMPQAIETMVTPDDLSSYDMESYKYSEAQKGGDPAETFEIREYRRADKMKDVHWKLSSKMDDIVVREHGLPIENRVMIIVDKLEDAPSEKDMDKRTEFAAAVSYTLLKKGIVHSIGWFNILTQQFDSFRIDNEESYWIAIKGLVSCPFAQEEKSSVDRFLEAGADEEYLSYIYISEKGRDLEKLYNYGSAKQYRTDNF